MRHNPVDPCALCGRAHNGSTMWSSTFAKHEAPEQAGYPETARLCDGCRDGFEYALTVATPKMSPETLRDIARHAAGFHDRVARANNRLCNSSVRASLKPGEAITSPHFRVSLRPTAPGKILHRLMELGAGMEQISVC